MMFMPELDWITDHSGTMLVDFVARFENLQRDMEVVRRKTAKSFTLQHLNKSERGPYRDYYDDVTRAIVDHWFARDIEAFQYRF